MSDVVKEEDQFAASPVALSVPRLWHGIQRAVKRIISSEAGLRCAGVAFYGFLSLFPAIAAAVILFGLFLDKFIIDGIVNAMAPLIPPGPEEILTTQLVKLESTEDENLGWGLLITFAFALWSGSRGTNAMVYAVNRAYRQKSDRGFFAGVVVSISLTLLAFLMAAVTILVIAVFPVIIQFASLPPAFETYANWLRWPVIAVLILVTTVLFYRIAPLRRSAKYRWIFPGAITASVLWLIASYGFSFYVENFGSYDVTFGSLAAVVVLLLWFYYSSMIFVFGAIINAELELETLRDTTIGTTRPVGKRGAFVADNIIDEL